MLIVKYICIRSQYQFNYKKEEEQTLWKIYTIYYIYLQKQTKKHRKTQKNSAEYCIIFVGAFAVGWFAIYLFI